MAVLTAAAVLAIASQYSDWDANWVVWQVFDAGTGHGESSGRADVVDPSGKYVGLMQIDYRLHGYTIEQMQDPVQNIEAAHKLWLASGIRPWPSAVKYKQMSISPDGWLSWAEKMPGRPVIVDSGFNGGVNTVKGLVFHSAEGWASTMLSRTSEWGYYSAKYPWHLSNLLDGRLVQHYPFTVRCWHGSAFNNDFVGMEHEGVSPEAGKGPLLNDLQVANARRVIADLSAWKGWTPRRPIMTGDTKATLYEHKETVWFGGTSTSCPNNRIPWDKILAEEFGPMKLNADGSARIEAEGNSIVIYNQNVPVLRIGGQTPGQIQKLFGDEYYNLAHLKADDGKNAPVVFTKELTD